MVFMVCMVTIYVRILVIVILCNQHLLILNRYTDDGGCTVLSQHVWKIKKSCNVFKDFNIIAVVSQ